MTQKKKMVRSARFRQRAAVGFAVACLLGRAEAGTPSERRAQLVEAQILGVHAFRAHLFRESGKGDPACHAAGALTDADLADLESHQAALLAEDVSSVRAWAEGRESFFDPAKDLEPLLRSGLTLADELPVNVFTRDLQRRAPDLARADVRAIANLYQTVLEVERDGDRLQDLYRFSIGLGLPVSIGQLELPGTDTDMLATGRDLEGRSCDSPVETSAAEWQIVGRKIWNRGEKSLHVRDARVLADELLAEPGLAPLVPRLRALLPRRIAVIGHSFTMDLHWSSPSAFAPIVAAMFARENPDVEFGMFQAGGLTAARAYRSFYTDALAWKPDVVLLVVAHRTEGNIEDARAARKAGMTAIEVGRRLETSPDRARFVCLDGIHMKEPYHRLMAREWVKVLVGAREPSLGS